MGLALTNCSPGVPEHAEHLFEVAANALSDLYSLNQIIRYNLARQAFKTINKYP